MIMVYNFLGETMKYLAVLLLVLTMAACTVRPQGRIHVEIENALKCKTCGTPSPVTIQVRCGWLGWRKTFDPGEAWYGHIPTWVQVDKIKIVIKD